MLDATFARQRQQRLVRATAQQNLDALIIGWSPHVYYLSAFRPFWQHEAGLILYPDGRTVLVAAGKVATVAADEILEFQASWGGTHRQEQPSTIAELIVAHLRGRGARVIGLDASAVSSQVLLQFDGKSSGIDPALWQMRRIKDADELALIRKAFECVDAMYRRARDILEPGVEEIRVFAELNAAAVATAGEPLTALLGNDYACGVGGGPARGGRRAQVGEIYILDVGPAYRGYFSDASRGFAVGRKPTDAQIQAQVALAGCFPIIERMARPGVRCQDIYQAVDQFLQPILGKGLSHHLGHGIGLQPHEFPHLNLKWDDTLREGEIFTAEPGVYGPHLAGGLRLENVYRVESNGVENLVKSPLELI